MQNLKDGLWLESYSLFVPYDWTLSCFAEALACKQADPVFISDERILVESHLLGCPFPFRLAFMGCQERIAHISISPVQLDCTAQTAYSEIQALLREILGLPQNPVEQLLNILNPDYKQSRWRFRNVEIVHAMEEHFGLCNQINIYIH